MPSSSARKETSLAKLIFRQYARSALFVILTVEVVLLLLYFGAIGVGARLTGELVGSFMSEAVHEFAASVTKNISEDFVSIEKRVHDLAAKHQPLFADPQSIRIGAEQPVIKEAPNGSYYQEKPTDGSGFFIPKSAVPRMTEREWLFATNSASLDPAYRAIVDGAGSLKVVAAYVNVDEPADMNRLYPYIPNVWEQYPEALDMKDYNFWYLADGEHNPGRTPQWTGVYLDPAGNGWMLSCISPVYVGQKLEAVVGVDVRVPDMTSKLSALKLPWNGSVALIDRDGSVISADEKLTRVLVGLRPLEEKTRGSYEPVGKENANPENINIKSLTDEVLRENLLQLLSEGNKGKSSTLFLWLGRWFGRLAGSKDTHLAGNTYFRLFETQKREPFLCILERIPETPWSLLFVFNERVIVNPQLQLAALTKLAVSIGWWVLTAVVLFYGVFFAYLWIRAQRVAALVAEPLEKLSLATKEMGALTAGQAFPESRIAEVDELSANFAKMSKSLAAKSMQLEESNEHYKDLSDAAADSLHNIGNKVHNLNRHLRVLDSVIASTDDYPEAFRRIRRGGPTSEDALRNFEAGLGKSVDAIKSVSRQMKGLSSEVEVAIDKQRQVYRSARESAEEAERKTARAASPSAMAENIDLSSMLADICRDFSRHYPALAVSVPPGVHVTGHRVPLHGGLENVIRNAIQASHSGFEVRISCESALQGAVVTVADGGEGIVRENLAKIGRHRGYTTKKNGQGLGLYSFNQFLRQSGGKLELHSDGAGRGTTVKITICNV